MNYTEFKSEFIKRVKAKNACETEFKRVISAESIEQLIQVIKDNLEWIRENEILDNDFINQFENKQLFNIGKDNVGLFNSGDRNSGDRNSGYLNSGDRNSGDRNSGDRNSGDRNSGYLNSGDRNSGDRNSGDRNSGYLNSGYRNSGIFCNRKINDKAIIFNKESEMTWDEWYNSKAYSITCGLTITEWIAWDNMTDEQKKENPEAFITEGMIKVYDYKQAWANLWNSLDDEQKEVITSIPNFNSEVFEDITGIKVDC